jgi:hypothetical protein
VNRSDEAHLASIVTALGQAVEGGHAWSVYPSEAKALLAEIERLRAEVYLLRTGREAARSYADRVEAEVVALRGERAAVVAWLGGEVDAAMEMHLPVRAATFLECAEAIERGAHRREEEK